MCILDLSFQSLSHFDTRQSSLKSQGNDKEESKTKRISFELRKLYIWNIVLDSIIAQMSSFIAIFGWDTLIERFAPRHQKVKLVFSFSFQKLGLAFNLEYLSQLFKEPMLVLKSPWQADSKSVPHLQNWWRIDWDRMEKSGFIWNVLYATHSF